MEHWATRAVVAREWQRQYSLSRHFRRLHTPCATERPGVDLSVFSMPKVGILRDAERVNLATPRCRSVRRNLGTQITARCFFFFFFFFFWV